MSAQHQGRTGVLTCPRAAARLPVGDLQNSALTRGRQAWPPVLHSVRSYATTNSSLATPRGTEVPRYRGTARSEG